ncbi:hypothetical protein D1631_15990 [Chryseobacterium nematophagum]|uniref:Uncharacterized protein n=1 Tax=Chryseobacterium nematophagum TaxID=2305228 RepID=A0A3M7TK87_9FLAO|nr:hypothetical protein [Chryseobacterium nematophagum]RNA63317.1 hypothetical protein D1631_15990 [Chryseobacterium nematophagum]
MSVIRNPNPKIFFAAFLLLIFFSCDQKKETTTNGDNEKIISVSFSNVGGKAGSYSKIKVNQDSLYLEKGTVSSKEHIVWKYAITAKDWRQLTSHFDIKTFNTIKSSESIQALNGIDETFQIKTSKTSHVYVNAYNDTIHYKQLQKFKDQLSQIIPKEYQ